MADGRDVAVWDTHAEQCREAERGLFGFQANAADVGGWLRDRVLDNLESGSQCVDVGCGPGYWRNLFEDHHYTGFDQSSGMLKLAKEIAGSKLESEAWVQGNGRNVSDSFPDKKFDMAFTASVLQHNRHEPDKTEIVQGIHSILKPGGFLLCTENTFREDNCPQSVGSPTYTDGYTFTPEGWKVFMLAAGFEFLDFNGKSEYLFKRV
jgi:ubiquinone/menaquinone biosynthesis C-methylase UbiE